jgi:hypothetical protein
VAADNDDDDDDDDALRWRAVSSWLLASSEQRL